MKTIIKTTITTILLLTTLSTYANNITITVDNGILQLPYNVDAKIKVYDMTNFELVTIRTDGYLDLNNLKGNKFRIEVEGYTTINFDKSNNYDKFVIEEEKGKPDTVKLNKSALMDLIGL